MLNKIVLIELNLSFLNVVITTFNVCTWKHIFLKQTKLSSQDILFTLTVVA